VDSKKRKYDQGYVADFIKCFLHFHDVVNSIIQNKEQHIFPIMKEVNLNNFII